MTGTGAGGALLQARYTRGSFTLDVDLSWDERVVAIFGPSGAGKSTLLEVALGLHPRARARVHLGGAWLEDAARGLRLAPEARHLGWVPQDPTLFPHLAVEGNLRFGLARGGAAGHAALDQAVEILELGPLLGRRVDALSGGERQRVAIARALASAPRALLLDEPLASLDVARRARAMRLLLRLRDELEIPMLAITHDPDEALLLGQRAVVIEGGREVASGPPAEVLWSRSVQPLAETMGLENVLEGRVVESGPGHSVFETPGGTRWVLPAPLPPGEAVCVGLRAEDVLLAVGSPGAVSARNVCAARVISCERREAAAWVRLAAGPGGDPLVAKVTAAAAEKLGLRPDARVELVVKAHALRRIA